MMSICKLLYLDKSKRLTINLSCLEEIRSDFQINLADISGHHFIHFLHRFGMFHFKYARLDWPKIMD